MKTYSAPTVGVLLRTKLLCSELKHLSINIIANVRHASLYQCDVRAMRKKKLKLVSDGSDSGSKKCKRGYGGANGGVWRSLLGRNLASVAVKMIADLI
jgi:hypothetical protein